MDKRELEMKCPKCGRFSLKQEEESVVCSFCGHQLSPGQEANFRLFQLLKREEGKHC
jgi:endogenous inhibitor of DNA gyrase (YacG/DUF329 family)